MRCEGVLTAESDQNAAKLLACSASMLSSSGADALNQKAAASMGQEQEVARSGKKRVAERTCVPNPDALFPHLRTQRMGDMQGIWQDVARLTTCRRPLGENS